MLYTIFSDVIFIEHFNSLHVTATQMIVHHSISFYVI